MLEPPSRDKAQNISHREALVDLSQLVGARGLTTTELVPGGKARFGNRLLDVIAEGDNIPRGEDIVVVEIRGNRLVVQAARRALTRFPRSRPQRSGAASLASGG